METISPVYARLVLRDLERQGIEPAPLFRGIALTREQLLRGGDIAMQDFLHILRVGEELSADGKLGFMLGRHMQVFALGPLGAGMAVAPTPRDGLQLLESYTRLHTTYMDIRARPSLQGMTLQLLYQQDTGDTEHFHTETGMLLLQQYVETLSGLPLVDASYELTIPEPANRSDYDEALHGTLRFDAGSNRVLIPRRWLDLPSPYFHAELWREAQLRLSRQLKEHSDREGNSFSRHMRARFRASEPPLPELGSMAASLHLSERTLNRRLQEEGTSFRQIKSAALAEWARLYLDQTDDSVEAIAAVLGYQDTANFRRAFRKSEGCSPMEYRSRAR